MLLSKSMHLRCLCQTIPCAPRVHARMASQDIINWRRPHRGAGSDCGQCSARSDDPYFCIYGGEDTSIKDFEGLLFHRIKQRAVFFFMMKLAGLAKTMTLRPVVRIINRSYQAMTTHLDDLEQQLISNKGPWICGAGVHIGRRGHDGYFRSPA